MKRVVLWAVFCCAAFLALAAEPSAVTARGGYTLDTPGGVHGDKVPASVVANLDSRGNGNFHFAAETHIDHVSPYPSLVIRLSRTKSLSVAGSTAVLIGSGFANDELVSIRAEFQDGGRGKKDHFSIVCRTLNDHVLYESEADLETGDILVAGGSR